MSNNNTLDGLEKIVSLRVVMTKVIPENLKLYFSHVSKSNFSLELTSLQSNLEWLIGFVYVTGAFL